MAPWTQSCGQLGMISSGRLITQVLLQPKSSLSSGAANLFQVCRDYSSLRGSMAVLADIFGTGFV